LSGLIVTAGVPHFIKGITGEKFQTPFGNPSSAVINVIFGWLCFVIAAVVLHFGNPRLHEYRALGSFGIGVLVVALLMANMWAKKPSKK